MPSVREMKLTGQDWCSQEDWTPRSLGDNNSQDYQFLSRLYVCGSRYNKVDEAILLYKLHSDSHSQTDADVDGDVSDESFVSQIVDDTEEGQAGDGDDKADRELKHLISLLEDKSGVGKRIRTLMPSCPQCQYFPQPPTLPKTS